MTTSSFFGDMLQTIADRGRRLLSASAREPGGNPVETMMMLCEKLLSSRGEASGIALAASILDRWRDLDAELSLDFLRRLASQFGPDLERLDKAVENYAQSRSVRNQTELHLAAEPRRQELIRRLNLAPGGTATLVKMREALLKVKTGDEALEALDADFAQLFTSWFNRGFLVLRSIDWSTPADILEKIIRYEAVHDIGGWDELRLRLAPEDRRCFAFFHPQLADDPLIFVEVALTKETPVAIAGLLAEARVPVRAADTTTAVFYSISNCQSGLRGISFGNFLIKQVVEELRRELPRLDTFVTLSPVPGFAEWLKTERASDTGTMIGAMDRDVLRILDEPGWQNDPAAIAALQPVMTAAVAAYFLAARDAKGRVIDPVARFHLGNGARLERIDFLADRSPKALRQSYGLMVNYLYKLDDIEANHEAFAGRGEVVTSAAIRHLIPAARTIRKHGSVAAKAKDDKEFRA